MRTILQLVKKIVSYIISGTALTKILFFLTLVLGYFQSLFSFFFLWLSTLVSFSTSLNSGTFIVQYYFALRTVIIFLRHLDFYEKKAEKYYC